MHHIILDSETDFDGWRKAARALALNDIAPADIHWSIAGSDAGLFDGDTSPLPSLPPRKTFNVPADFVQLAQTAILHRDPQRFAALYRLLCRLKDNSQLLQAATDIDVAHAQTLAKAVRRDEHKMKAFVRFREFGRERDSRYVAWFEPAHFIVEATAPFFARRFADMEWSILTPDLCAHWDGHEIAFTPGAVKGDAPTSDPLEDIWRRYYASIFNPARLKIKAMQAEMPKKYWHNLPEAPLIKPMIAAAERKTQAMIDSAASAPRKTPQRREEPMTMRATKDLAPHGVTGEGPSIAMLREEAAHCRSCPLWQDATQTVFGEGPKKASVMMVGEQPGDKEDLSGKPFIGPAGQMLDRALDEAGVDRTKVYVTNAVKHFKFVPRGKFRLHQKPNTSEIKACRQWYERELAAVKPTLVVAMGASAAQSVLGKITPIGKTRGKVMTLEDGTRVLITVHPSYLLRLPDEDAKAREYANFVSDLKIAGAFVNEVERAA